MKKNVTLLFGILLTTILINSCNKSKIADDVPPCIKEQIKNCKKNSCCIKGECMIREYLFDEKTVYSIVGNDCGINGSMMIFDVDCNFLGSIGGIHNNNTMIQNKDFSSAVFIRTIWEK